MSDPIELAKAQIERALEYASGQLSDRDKCWLVLLNVQDGLARGFSESQLRELRAWIERVQCDNLSLLAMPETAAHLYPVDRQCQAALDEFWKHLVRLKK